jgi:hypothetical protein
MPKGTSLLEQAEKLAVKGAARRTAARDAKSDALIAARKAAVKPRPKTETLATVMDRLPPEAVAVNKAPAVIKRASGAGKRAPGARRELAVRYPEIAPPVKKIDKKTGKEFLSKGTSKEAEAAAADMKRITAEMADEGYTPYFSPEDRFYADPAPYNLQGNTRDIKPAKQATIEQYEGRAYAEDAMDRLRAAYGLGSQHPGASRWYATGQLEKSFIDALGPEAGRAAYKRNFADAMAATTGGMDPAANLRLAHYMNYLTEAGGDVPLASYDFPYPIGGGKYGVVPNARQHDRMIRQGEGLSISNPKRFNFSANFLGDTDRATLDEQMMSAWDPKIQMPPTNSYGIYEGALAQLARQLGVAPAEAQDVMWAGIKLPKEANYTPRPMIDIVNDAIERTSRLTGADPDEVVEGIVSAKRPLYARGGRVDSLAVKRRC